MGLISRIFRAGAGAGAGDAKPPAGASSQFAESQAATSLERTRSRNAPRRDLVKLVLRETTRKHGIPTDWIDCRTLSVLTRQHKSGMHVQFLVRKADQQLLPYIHALQESFWERILKMDPLAREWLFSVGWEFYGRSEQGFAGLPDPESWDAAGDTQVMEGDTQPPEQVDEDVASDLEALQQLISTPGELGNVPDATTRQHKPGA
jgi:hypothetical protein